MSILVQRKNDQVFQLSLTELAFILIFLLLLLSGWMIGLEKGKRKELEEKLSESSRDLDAYISKVKAMEGRESELQLVIDKAIAEKALAEKTIENAESVIADLKDVANSKNINPDEIISNLQDCSRNKADSERLSRLIEDLESQITALEKVKNVIESTDAAGQSSLAKKEVISALALKSEIEKQLKKPIDPGSEYDLASSCVSAISSIDESAKLATNLRGQLSYVMRQLEQSKNPKGFGLPPCWLDEAGKTQKLFDIEIADSGLIVSPGWPPDRAGDALKLPAAQEMTSVMSSVAIAKFRPDAEKILQWSKVQDPECRHYASVVVSATKVDAAVYGKNAVYDYFYPFGKETLKK